ncbi:hypothetical protein QE152_g40915, partial [Popillia japonica]
LQNPGSGPATPNAITFGNPVDIFEDFAPNESDPAHPPPTYNPFIPQLIITIETVPGVCALTAPTRVTLTPIATVNIISATVLRDGINTGVTLAQLQAGYVFTTPGNYSVVVVYRFLGNAQTPPSTVDETFTRNFTVAATPFPYTQRQSLVSGYVSPGEPLLFDTAVVDNLTIRNHCCLIRRWWTMARLVITHLTENSRLTSAEITLLSGLLCRTPALRQMALTLLLPLMDQQTLLVQAMLKYHPQ